MLSSFVLMEEETVVVEVVVVVVVWALGGSVTSSEAFLQLASEVVVPGSLTPL